MAFEEYEKKRDFAKTPEPRGEKERSSGIFHFVVHKHWARRTHYDLRLESEGVLKSWAIPKDISFHPEIKNLAVMVEDHPLEYKDFEGVIPEGNYGAGTVMIWDEGVWRPRQEGRALADGIAEGKFSFLLEGKKLKGEYALVRLKGSEKNEWLLIKKGDSYITGEKFLDVSVRSGRTKEKIEADEIGAKSQILTAEDLKLAEPAVFPEKFPPMLAKLTDEPFDSENWLFEIKWDGWRLLAFVKKQEAVLFSRGGQNYSEKFPIILENFKKFAHEAVFDGEAVVLDRSGRANFQLLQNYFRTGRGPLFYYIFDLLYLDGYDLKNLPLLRRKEILSEILPELPAVRYVEHIKKDGKIFFEAAREKGIEGIMAKFAQSAYRPGRRSADWLKIKSAMRQEAVIGGFTAPRGSRKYLGSLLLGIYENGKLKFIGSSGGGFSEDELKELRAKLDGLAVSEPPFEKNLPARWPKEIYFVRPELVCEVAFSEWTQEGYMRHPKYLGLREEKRPKEVVRENSFLFCHPCEGRDPEKINLHWIPGQARNDMIGERKEIIGGKELKLTNLNKIYWPKEKYTKGELIEYYREISPFILPYLKDRPESLNRFPKGIEGFSFYQKNVEKENILDWMETAKIFSESEERPINYILCQDEAALVYLANLGCIEMNPWNSTIDAPENPDYLVLDLDPEDIGFDKVVETALAAKELMDELGLAGFCKTSGATGLHIFLPLAKKYNYEQTKEFARLLAYLINARRPEITSIQRLPKKRQKKVYVDFLQNRRGQTMASAYSVRPRPGAPVSAPLEWGELSADLSPLDFTMKNIKKRLDKKSDLWKGVLGKGIDIEKVLDEIKKGGLI